MLLLAEFSRNFLIIEDITNVQRQLFSVSAYSYGATSWLTSAQVAHASEDIKMNVVYEVGELFELGIQLSYLLLLLGLLGVGTFFVIRQVLVRRELDLSAKELQVRGFYFLFFRLFFFLFSEKNYRQHRSEKFRI